MHTLWISGQGGPSGATCTIPMAMQPGQQLPPTMQTHSLPCRLLRYSCCSHGHSKSSLPPFTPHHHLLFWGLPDALETGAVTGLMWHPSGQRRSLGTHASRRESGPRAIGSQQIHSSLLLWLHGLFGDAVTIDDLQEHILRDWTTLVRKGVPRLAVTSLSHIFSSSFSASAPIFLTLAS